jgi:hypothetical protein
MWYLGRKGANLSSHRRAPTGAWQSQSHILVDTRIHDLQGNDNVVALDLRRNVYLSFSSLDIQTRIISRPLELTSATWKQLDDVLGSGPVAYGLDTGIWTPPMIAWVIDEEFGIH